LLGDDPCDTLAFTPCVSLTVTSTSTSRLNGTAPTAALEVLILTGTTGSAAHASIEGICLQGPQLLCALPATATRRDNSPVDRA
jgi:hypothetical protein